jgi:hypothetical protein
LSGKTVIHTRTGIETDTAFLSAVDNGVHFRQRQTGFGNVCCQNYSPISVAGGLQYGALLCRGEPSMQNHDLEAGMGRFKSAACPVYFANTGRKTRIIPFRFVQAEV